MAIHSLYLASSAARSSARGRMVRYASHAKHSDSCTPTQCCRYAHLISLGACFFNIFCRCTRLALHRSMDFQYCRSTATSSNLSHSTTMPSRSLVTDTNACFHPVTSDCYQIGPLQCARECTPRLLRALVDPILCDPQ